MISRAPNLPVALRIALRELRGGLSGFRIFMACLILGVAAIAAVGSLTAAIEEGLASEGQSILGGDIEINARRQPAPENLMTWANAQDGTLSKSARLRTMARTTGAIENVKSTLVELRPVDQHYPLYGALLTKPQLTNDDLFSKRGNTWGTAIDSLLADRLGVEIGDTLQLGSITADIRAFIDVEPDKANLGFQLGPSVMIRFDALAETGLVVQGSMIDYQYKLRLNDPTTLEAVRADHDDTFEKPFWRVRDRTTSAPGLRRFIDQMGMFLTLVGLAALVVGGVGVGNAVKGYMDRKTRTIATLKILGASGSTIFATYFFQVMLIGVISVIIGLLVGSFLPAILAQFLPDTLPVKPEGGVYPTALILAATYGIMITVAFTAWPLGKARDLPAVRLFRALVAPENSRPRGVYVALIAFAALVTVVLAVGLSNNSNLAAGFVAGAAGALVLLRSTSWGIEKGAAKAPRPKGALLRMAIANIHRPGAATGAVVLSLGLGLTLFAGLALIEGNLTKQLREEVPTEAPAFFLMDIQPWQKDPLINAATKIEGVSDINMVPNLRGRITHIKGVPAAEAEIDGRYNWIIRGDRGLAYADELPAGSEVVDGDWWPEGYAGGPEVSLGKEEADGLGLEIGDTITISVLGRDITATVRSLRQINWGSFGFNFVVMFDPNTLKAAPHTFMATLKATTAAENETNRLIIRDYTNVTAVRMKEVLSNVNTMLAQIGTAVRATSLVAIVSGILVLAGAIAAGFRQRVYESVILKVVGAIRSQILRAYLMEYMLIGFVTAAIALALGGLAGWVVVTQVWEMQFSWLPAPMIITVTTSLAVTVLFGLMSSWRALSIKPNTVLREE